MKGPSPTKFSHLSSESPLPSVPAFSPSSRFPTLVSPSGAVEPQANNKKRCELVTSNGEVFPYKCNCGKQFRTAQEYGGHQNAHTRPKKFMNKCLERVRLNYLMLPGYSLPPDCPTFLQEEAARFKQKQRRVGTGFGRIFRPMEKVGMHPSHSDRSPIDKNIALSIPSLPFNSFYPKVREFCQASHEENDNLSPWNFVPLGNAGLGANNTMAHLLKSSFTHPQLAPRGINLDLASRNLVSFWNPDRGSKNSMTHRCASVAMRASAPPLPASRNSGGNVLTRPRLEASGVHHVEDDNPSGLDLDLRI